MQAGVMGEFRCEAMVKRSHICVYVHYVWATWDREPLLPAGYVERLYPIIRTVFEKHGCELQALGGMPDHVHLLAALSATVTLADLAHDAKGATSRWLNQQLGGESSFQWQGRYGAFSVSPHERTKVVNYIRNQERHHADGQLWPTVEDPSKW